MLFLVLLASPAALSPATESPASAETPPTASESSPASEEPPKDFSEKYQLRVVTNEAARAVITGKVTNDETSFQSYLHWHVRWMFNAGGGHVTGGPSDGNIVLFQTRVGVDF